MSNDVSIDKQPAVFVTVELWVKGILNPVEAGMRIGEDLESMIEKGCEITSIRFDRGIAGTPVMEDE